MSVYVTVCKYGPKVDSDVRINSAALAAAAPTVANAYAFAVPSFPKGTPCIESSPSVLTNKTSGEL